MAFESLGNAVPSQVSSRNSMHDRLSPTGQMIGWGVFGGLVVMGFAFGIVVGFDRPRPVIVAKNAKETEIPKVETAKIETPKANPKTSPEPSPPTFIKETPAPKPVVAIPPKVDPKPPMPATPTPPKTNPKPPVTAATTPPKTEPTPKKEDIKAVSFKTEVLPILRRTCLDCHGLSKGKPKGDVDLTTIAQMKKSPGKIVVAGNPEQSDLYNSITDGRMPPEGKPKPNKDELQVLKNWILSGAKD